VALTATGIASEFHRTSLLTPINSGDQKQHKSTIFRQKNRFILDGPAMLPIHWLIIAAAFFGKQMETANFLAFKFLHSSLQPAVDPAVSKQAVRLYRAKSDN
jgi:hypothetical protein